jgi:hypothetical protein
MSAPPSPSSGPSSGSTDSLYLPVPFTSLNLLLSFLFPTYSYKQRQHPLIITSF